MPDDEDTLQSEETQAPNVSASESETVPESEAIIIAEKAQETATEAVDVSGLLLARVEELESRIIAMENQPNDERNDGTESDTRRDDEEEETHASGNDSSRRDINPSIWHWFFGKH